MKKIFISFLAVLMISTLILGSCGDKETTTPVTTEAAAKTTTTTTMSAVATTEPAATTETSKYGGTLRMAEGFQSGNSMGWFAENMFFTGGMETCLMVETLIKGNVDGTFSPLLATHWVIADDLKSITLTLRKGVKFHDGSDFNAEVAKWNMDQFTEAGCSEVAGITSVEIIDDYTIKINVTQWNNIMLSNLANAHMVSKAAFEARGGKEGLRWSPVGTGPFKFVSYDKDVLLKTERFDDYWDEGKPYLDSVEVHYIADPLTRSAAFEAGELDVITCDPSRVEYDLVQKGYNLVKGYSGFAYFAPDSKNADSPLSKVEVRQAIEYAIDRDAIIKAMGYGFFDVSYQFAYPGSAAYIDDLEVRSYNTDKAKELLASAGYPDGFDMEIFSGSTISADAVTAVQGYLSKIGINAKVNLLDTGAWGNDALTGWGVGFLCNVSPTQTNPHMGLNMFWTQTTPFNASTLKTDEFQALYNASASAKDVAPVLIQKVTQYIFDNAMFLPLYAVARVGILKSYVHDTGYYTEQYYSYWNPADAWFSK